jgi:hypothetical protein
MRGSGAGIWPAMAAWRAGGVAGAPWTGAVPREGGGRLERPGRVVAAGRRRRAGAGLAAGVRTRRGRPPWCRPERDDSGRLPGARRGEAQAGCGISGLRYHGGQPRRPAAAHSDSPACARPVTAATTSSGFLPAMPGFHGGPRPSRARRPRLPPSRRDVTYPRAAARPPAPREERPRRDGRCVSRREPDFGRAVLHGTGHKKTRPARSRVVYTAVPAWSLPVDRVMATSQLGACTCRLSLAIGVPSGGQMSARHAGEPFVRQPLPGSPGAAARCRRPARRGRGNHRVQPVPVPGRFCAR